MSISNLWRRLQKYRRQMNAQAASWDELGELGRWHAFSEAPSIRPLDTSAARETGRATDHGS
jgi:hypothetical protein